MKLKGIVWFGFNHSGQLAIPFGSLTISTQRIALSVPITSLDKVTFGLPNNNPLSFTPEQVTRVSPHGASYWFLPSILLKGVQIHHKVLDYPEKVVFWHFHRNNEEVLKYLSEAGFNTSQESIKGLPR